MFFYIKRVKDKFFLLKDEIIIWTKENIEKSKMDYIIKFIKIILYLLSLIGVLSLIIYIICDSKNIQSFIKYVVNLLCGKKIYKSIIDYITIKNIKNLIEFIFRVDIFLFIISGIIGFLVKSIFDKTNKLRILENKEKMDICNTNNPKDIILEYINDERNEQAVLIDGEWGIGKTFFVKNKIIPAINDLKNKQNFNTQEKSYVIYISLYGVKDSKEITNNIHIEILNEKIKLREKTKKITDITSKISNIFFKSKDINTEEMIELLEVLNMQDYVIIFDDLERCEMGINEVLGYINDLVEHRKVKVIIVANEEQIGKLSLSKNLEQKYNVVLAEKLDLKRKDNNIYTMTAKTNDEKTQINLEELKEYTQEIFKTDLIYKEIKEKLIGITIKYIPNIREILDDIIEIYVNHDNSKKIINRNKDKIIQIIESNENYNIRTIIFAFISFEKINKIIDKKDDFDKEYIDKIVNDIFIYCIDLSFKIKNGEELYKWEIDKEIVLKPLLSEYHSFKYYRFIDLYLTKRIINKENIYMVIENEIEESKRIKQEQIDKNLSLPQLYNNWWYIDDDELYKKINNLQKEIESNKYELQDFKKIYILIVQLEYYNILESNQVNKIQDIILKQVENNEYIHRDYRDRDINTKKLNLYMENRYLELKNQLKEILENKRVNKNKAEINSYIKNTKDWIFDFGDYCEKNKDIFDQRGEFFKLIDIENLKNVILLSSNEDIYDFPEQLKIVYRFENLKDSFAEDIDSLKKFEKSLEIDDIKGKTKKIAIQYLKDYIQGFIKKLEE